jgi:hypothetical protein
MAVFYSTYCYFDRKDELKSHSRQPDINHGGYIYAMEISKHYKVRVCFSQEKQPNLYQYARIK